MQNRYVRGSFLGALFVAAVAGATLWATVASATITQGDFSVFGFFESRDSGRWGEGEANGTGTPTTYTQLTPGLFTADLGTAAGRGGGAFDFNHWDLVQARQLGNIRPDYHFVKNYSFLGRFDTLFLKDADFFMIYRPWYDATGSIKDKGRAEPNRDWFPYNQATLQQQYFQNNLHEYYAQLNFTDNFSMRIGKQQIIWSEADALSGTEITNPVNATYHGFNFESPEDQRQNVRMVKFDYILPDFLKTSDNQITVFCIPGDFQGDTVIADVSDPRSPWSVAAATGRVSYNLGGQQVRDQMFPDAPAFPLTPFAAAPGVTFFNDTLTPNISHTPVNALQNSEFGAKYQTLLPIGNGLQMSFIYLYEARENGTGIDTARTTPFLGAPYQGLLPAPFFPVAKGVFFLPGTFVFPVKNPAMFGTEDAVLSNSYRRKNFFGVVGTYYDKDITDIVFRYDTLYAPNVSLGDVNSPTAIRNTQLARFIIAGDRPTYIPLISKQHTFITFQYVNTWYPNLFKGAVPSIANTIGKVRDDNNFFFLATTNWLINGQLTSGNVVAWDVDDNVGSLSTTNSYRYSRNVLFGLNIIWYLGRTGRYTDPFVYSRSQSTQQEIEFTLTYEI